jgi:hypothetical protein
MKENIRKVFILDLCELPIEVRNCVKKWLGFHNDTYLPVRSEFDPESWSKGMSEVEAYWKDQKECRNYKGSLEDFIKDYALEFDIWFIQQNFDLTGIDQVLVDVRW